MIVRCSNCNSAFAVDDDKVRDKKFAFNCPKCGTENIFDNKSHEKSSHETVFDMPAADSPLAHDSIFHEESETAKDAFTVSDNDDLFKDFESTEETSGDETLHETESIFDDENLSDDDFDLPEIDLDTDEDDTESSEDTETLELLDDEIPDIELDGLDEKDESVTLPSDDEILFDDDFISEEKNILDDSDMPDMASLEESVSDKNADRDTKITEQSEIDRMFAASGTMEPDSDEDLPEIVLSDDTEIDEFDFDEDSSVEEKSSGLGLTIEEDTDDIFDEEESPDSSIPDFSSEDEEDESLTINLDELDIDLEGTEDLTDSERNILLSDEADESTTLDLDKLDIDIEQTDDLIDSTLLSESAENDESTTLDLDKLDIDLEEPGEINFEDSSNLLIAEDSDSGILTDFDETKKPSKSVSIFDEEDEDESITIDLNKLDLDLAESQNDTAPAEQHLQSDHHDDTSISMDFTDIDEDDSEEDLKLDLDFEDYGDEEDESITIDLDSLDIDLKDKISIEDVSEEDEKLTLDDAGLTFDELDTGIPEDNEIKENTAPSGKLYLDSEDEDDIKLSITDIDPDLKLDQISESITYEEKSIADTMDELPEIDIDKFDAMTNELSETGQDMPDDEDFVIDLDIDDEFEDESDSMTSITAPVSLPVKDDDLLPDDFEEADFDHSEIRKSAGSVDFSIDLSLKYSRIGAILRLLGLYLISMIPHLVVAVIYTVLSTILGFINQIVILSTGRCVEDFSQIIENSLRYYLYIETSITGIVEDQPIFTGKEDLNHQMQFNVSYPLKYSRIMAFMRLSVAGMVLMIIPHLILMILLTVTVPFVYIAGIILVIFTGRWPGVLFNYLTRYFRYLARLSSYAVGLTDKYPPLKL